MNSVATAKLSKVTTRKNLASDLGGVNTKDLATVWAARGFSLGTIQTGMAVGLVAALTFGEPCSTLLVDKEAYE